MARTSVPTSPGQLPLLCPLWLLANAAARLPSLQGFCRLAPGFKLPRVCLHASSLATLKTGTSHRCQSWQLPHTASLGRTLHVSDIWRAWGLVLMHTVEDLPVLVTGRTLRPWQGMPSSALRQCLQPCWPAAASALPSWTLWRCWAGAPAFLPCRLLSLPPCLGVHWTSMLSVFMSANKQ